MKHLKGFAIGIIAGVALLAVIGASPAGAETVLCTEKAAKCPASKADGVGTEIKMSLSGTSKLTTSFLNIECSKSSSIGYVTSVGEKINASLESFTFDSCNCEVKTLAKGTLELTRIAGSENATVKSTGTEVTTQCSTAFGKVHCIYKTEATDLGTLTGGTTANVDISSAEIPRLSTNALCAEKANWDATYEVTSPKPLYIESEAAPPPQTTLCTVAAGPCPVGTADGVGTEIKASLVAGAKAKLTTGYKEIECGKSSITAKVTNTSANVVALVEGLTLEECNCTVAVIQKGTLELEHISDTINATVKSSQTEITTSCTTELGTIHCIYETEHTDLGVLEGGSPADLRAEKGNIPRLATDSLCGEKALWDAEYEVTSPKPLYIESVESEAAGPTILCTEKASPCPAGKSDGLGTEIKMSLSGTSKLTTSFFNIECSKSSIISGVTSVRERISAGVKALSFEECNCEVKVLTKGTLQLEHIASSENATVKSSGTEVTTECSTIFGKVHCIYVTENTDFGTLTGGNPAVMDTGEVNVPRLATNGLCAEKASWDVKYEVTSPKPLYIEPE